MTRTVFFRLARPLPTWNTVMRTGSSLSMVQRKMVQRKELNKLAKEVWGAILEKGQRLGGHPPFARAKIRIVRYSLGEPDPEGVSAKFLLDVLQPQSGRHPYGLGIIADDTAACLGPAGAELICVRVAHKSEQCTMVTIEGEDM